MSVELVPWPIPPGLRGQVVRLTGYAERLVAPTVYEELPATFVPLILNVGSPYRLLDADGVREYPASFVAGLGVAPAYVQSTCAALCVQVDLSPLAACRVLRVPMRELADRVVALDELLGRGALELEGRLADAADWDERRSLAEAFVVRRLREAPPLPADVEYAWRRLGETGGTIRVGELVTELRCSRKHLEARFREAVGLPPKTAAALFASTAHCGSSRRAKGPRTWPTPAATPTSRT